MKWASAISEATEAAAATEQVVDLLSAGLGGDAPDLVLLFASPHHAAALASCCEHLKATWDRAEIVGCVGGGVVGDGHEVEQRRALAVCAGSMPGVTIGNFHVPAGSLPEIDDGDGWSEIVGIEAGADAQFLVFADPMTSDPFGLIAALDKHFPDGIKVGGIASGSPRAEGYAMVCGGETVRGGAVGVSLRGDVRIDTVVAQGCRPIGEPMLVTRCEGNRIQELAGREPIKVLRELYRGLGERDRGLFVHSLFIGVEMADKIEYRHGDFLVRNIIGMDPEDESIAVNAHIEPWQAVQFHLRDARTSRDDLDKLLARYREENPEVEAAGALMFSCLGRGLHLYQRPDHDTDLFRDHLDDVPLTGLFCNGEIGPVAGRTFLHGYTSVFAVFSGASEAQ